MNYKREYKKYLTSSVLDTANNRITSHSFITAFAVYLGLSNFAIGIYAVLDTITNIIQVFAAPLFSRIGQSKFVVLTNYTILGVILDKFTANGYELYGFMVLFVTIFLIAFIDIFIRINTYKPIIEDKKVTIKETIVRPANDKSFRKVLIVGGLNRFANGIGIMYLNVFLLRYLNVGYIYYSILNILVNFSEALFSKFWATKSQNRKWNKVLAPMSIIYIFAFLMLFTLNDSVLIFCLPIIYILLGFGNSAYEMFDHIAIYEHSKEDYKTSFVTFERFIEGIVTALLPIVSYAIFPENSISIKITFIIAIIVYLILFIYVQARKEELKNSKT